MLESRMDIPRSLATLSSVIDTLEEADVDLRRFRLRERDLMAEGEVVADAELGVDLCTAVSSGVLSIESVRTDPPDGLSIDLGPVPGLIPQACREHLIEVSDVRLDDTTLEFDLALSIPVDPEVGAEPEPVPPASDRFDEYRDESVPAFDDRDYLQALYDGCDTFDEMREIIDLDVTTETVRRYMIDAGVHEPNSYRTDSVSNRRDDDFHRDADESDDESDVDVILADGIGLPDEITIDDFIATVRSSKTLYEVQQSMDLGRDEVHDILEDLNLLDLVVGRLAMESERDVTRDEIIERLRQRVA